MLSMVDRQSIIHMYRVQGLGKNEITRIMGYSFHTVDKVIKSYEAAIRSEEKDEALNTLLCVAPHYDTSKRTERVVTTEIAGIISGYLRDNEIKRSTGMKKQCMRKKDMHEQLIRLGYRLAYSTLCQYIRRKEKKDGKERPKEAYVRQHYTPGQVCEFDWGEVQLLVRGKRQRFYLAVFTLAHSNGRYAYLFRHQNALAFMESHRNFFRDVKGIPSVMVYDNMRVAIQSFVGGKTPTETLLRMSSFYCYDYRFCNIRAGWEKGHVERSVEFVRRKAFSLGQDFGSIEEAQTHLDKTCRELNAAATSPSTSDKKERLAADIAALHGYPGEMGCFEMHEHNVDKWGTVTVLGSHYSVPDSLVGKKVSVRLYSEKISVFYDGKKVAAHERSYRQGAWSMKLEHYLDTFLRKPGALKGSVALKQAEGQIRGLFESYFKDTPKDFVLLIQYAADNTFSASDIIRACKSLRSNGIRNVSIDQIKLQMHSATNVERKRYDTEEPQYTYITDAAHQARQIEKEAENALDSITSYLSYGSDATTIQAGGHV